MTGFLLIRHGSCAHVGASLPGRSAGVHLDARGRQEAAALAERLAGAPLAAIYSSPRERARETAAPLAERLGLTVHVSERLDEVEVGAWTGRPFAELEGEEAWRAWNAFRSGTRAPGGESVAEVTHRVTSELLDLRERHPGGWVALVTHAEIVRLAVAHFAGIPVDLALRLEVGTGSLSALELGSVGARILRLNESPDPPWHLSL